MNEEKDKNSKKEGCWFSRAFDNHPLATVALAVIAGDTVVKVFDTIFSNIFGGNK